MADTQPSQSQANQSQNHLSTTRFQYQRDDEVVASFFEANIYKGAALLDVIYLFTLDYGKDANVSQLLRDRIMKQVGSNAGASNNVSSNTAAKLVTELATESVSESTQQNLEHAPTTVESESETKQEAGQEPVSQPTQSTEPDSATEEKFDINDMV